MKQPRFRLRAAGVTAAGIVVGGLAAAAVLAEDFTWTGGDIDECFHSHCNWHPGLTCTDSLPYPDGCGDTATFPWRAGGPWAVDLTMETIGVLTIDGSVDFAGSECNVPDPVILTTELLLITPTEGDIEITITAGEGSRIEVPAADPCP